MGIYFNPLTFLDINRRCFNSLYPHITSALFAGGGPIGIAPAGKIARMVVTTLINDGYAAQSVAAFDKVMKSDFPIPVLPYEDITKVDPQRVYILSPSYARPIHARLLSLGVDDRRITTCQIPDLLPADEMLEEISSSANEENIAILSELLANDPFVVVHCPGFFYDMNDKIRIFSEIMGRKVVLIDYVESPLPEGRSGVFRANMVDTINFIKRCQLQDDILFFSLNSAWHLVIPLLMREAFSKIKIIIYMYEWLEHHFPPEKKEMLRRITNLPMAYVDGEYETYRRILQGEIADGIVFKHGGSKFTVLDHYPNPTLCFPTYLSRTLYQDPIRGYTGQTDRIVFLGALPPVWNDFELFDESYVIKAFHTVTGQGFTLDVYEPRSQEIIDEYKVYFAGNQRVIFFPGKPLDIILPEISGKYHWGFMAFDHSNISSCHETVEVALPAKIYSYAALGIPILATDELTCVAEIVKKHEIGITFSSDDLPRLHEILRNADHRKLTENVLRFRETFCLEEQQRHFVKFLQDIMERQR